jgi:hypothetical protein
MSTPGSRTATDALSDSAADSPRSRRVTLRCGETAADLLRREQLFAVDSAGIARLPMLIGGALWIPEVPPVEALEPLLTAGRRSLDIGETHLVFVEGQIDGRALRALAVPRVMGAEMLIPRDISDQIHRLHPLDFASIQHFVDTIGAALSADGSIVGAALPLAAACSDQPEFFVRLGFHDMYAAFNGQALGVAIDREMSYAGRPGRDFLDGWVEIAAEVRPGGMATARAGLSDVSAQIPAQRRLRAVPMSQLHITAGNSPVVPAVSALRALATKGPMTVKLPSGALVAGSAFAFALWASGPEHPLVRHASIAYWQGGDEVVESALCSHGAFQRIVVWGSRASVESVTRRAAGTKTLVFNPRYGLSLIGREALLPAAIDETVRLAAQDTMVWNQQACIASLVHYVEGGDEDIDRYCVALTEELALWDTAQCHRPTREVIGRIRSARRGELSAGKWRFNGPPVAPTSAVVRIDREFDLSAHPQARVVIVRPVADIRDTLHLMHAGVSSVGILPRSRIDEVRDEICGRGVTSVLPLGEVDTLFVGAPHDGLRPLSELVSWAVS